MTKNINKTMQDNMFGNKLEKKFAPKEESVDFGSVGKNSNVQVTFTAYPEPTSGYWTIDNVKLALNDTNTERRFISYQISTGLNENEYLATLTMKGSKFTRNQKISLDVMNEIEKSTFKIDVFKSENNHSHRGKGKTPVFFLKKGLLSRDLKEIGYEFKDFWREISFYKNNKSLHYFKHTPIEAPNIKVVSFTKKV